jgi:hypothetical protein
MRYSALGGRLLIALTLDARRVLRINQRMLGELLGLSRRTI